MIGGVMREPPTGSHPAREVLDREMRESRDDVLRMGSMVVAALDEATEALVAGDRDRATAVIQNDVRINDMQAAILVRIAATIATQAPVARDLRYLLALDRVTYELERMGDHAASVAKQARRLAAGPGVTPAVDLAAMGEQSAILVHLVLRALVEVDVEAARAAAARDDEIDHLYRAIFDEVLGLMRADAANVDRGTVILFAAYDLERIGDRATNIAEDLVFLAIGEIEDLNAKAVP